MAVLPPGRPARVAIVVIDCDAEALTLRQAIECFSLGDVAVDLLGVGRGSTLIGYLRGRDSRAPHLVLCCHGDEEGIILPELHPSVAAEERYVGHFGADAVRKEARLKGRVVLSTGCSTAGLAEAFLDAGASAYIAPTGDPYGAAPLAFLMAFYYRLLVVGEDLEAAVRAARRIGGDARMFRLFSRG
jgi:hypothetical protein